jgi:predicted dehydrogenase
MDTVLRAAVIGAGLHGLRHARKYQGLPGVRLCAVVDVDRARAARLAAETGAVAHSDHRAVLGEVDVASVVVPAHAHHEVGRDLLAAGVHVLMEKPIAASVPEGRALTRLAATHGRVLQIGHLERFNPVLRALRARARAPRFIEAQRLAPFSARGTEVNVVLDLMIHDIDLTLMLAQGPVVRVEASGARVLSDQIDVAHARLELADGVVAQLTASRVSFGRQRRLGVLQDDGYLVADLAGHVLETYGRIGRPDNRRPGIAGSRERVVPGDALRDEIETFLTAVRTGAAPSVSGEDGVRALAAAEHVVEQIERRSRGVARAQVPGSGAS